MKLKAVFIAASPRLADPWIREWGFDLREVKVATRLRDVHGLFDGREPSEIPVFVCGDRRPGEGQTAMGAEWDDMLDYLTARGVEIIDAQNLDTGLGGDDMAALIPEDWPGEDVNVEVWSIYDTPGQRFRCYWRVRVTHRATGAVAERRGRYARDVLSEALRVARRRARAYEAVGLGDLAATVREWWLAA